MTPVIEMYMQKPRLGGLVRKRQQLWRFRFRAGNGKIIAVSSESYTNRQDAIDAANLAFGSLGVVVVRA